MNTIEAIEHILNYFDIPSIYQLSKDLSDNTLNIQSIQLSYYLSGERKMSPKVADRFLEIFDIEISDPYQASGGKKWL